MESRKSDFSRLISIGAIIALIGYITSGPAGFMLVKLTRPQQEWVTASAFAANYNFVQDIPYYLGILLIGGMLMIAAGHYLNFDGDSKQKKFYSLLSLLLTTAFAALIFFNYICQTTFVRHLALHYTPENDAVISTFSMANPMSLSWAVEMWGYGIPGAATWLMAGYYKQKNNFIRSLLILNGIVSLLSVAFTVININWVLTPAGIIAYMFWNILMIVLMIMIYLNSKASSTE